DLNPERDLSRPPLFQVMFAIQDVPTQPLSFSGAEVSRRVHAVHATHFDLELYLSTEGDAWSGFVGYNSDLFSLSTIERMIGYYQTLLEAVLAESDRPVSQAPMLTPAEQHQLLVEWNDNVVDYPQNKCLHRLFEEQVEKTPEAVAAVFG